jgi:hypothetical protein
MLTRGGFGPTGVDVGWSVQAASAALANEKASAVRKERMGFLKERVSWMDESEQIS